MDYQLGKILDVMDELALWRNTVVIFTSDHGMHVGEKGVWGKWTLFDEASRVPLIIHSPMARHAASFGKHFGAPVELIDLFPTLLDLTNTRKAFDLPCPLLTMPNKQGPREAVKGESPVRNQEGHIFRHIYCDDLDGYSLVHALDAVSGVAVATTATSTNKAFPFALTQRMSCKPPRTVAPLITDTNSSGWTDYCPFKRLPRDPALGAMGYSMRTEQWRYTAWLELDVNTFLPALNKPPLAEELYDHRNDERIGASRTHKKGNRLGTQELQNLAREPAFALYTHKHRTALYSFLFHNCSFQHLFQLRLSFQGDDKMLGVLEGRYHNSSRPHHTLYKSHYYEVV